MPLHVAGYVAALFLLLLTGCTAAERSGYSKIPHNTPGAWTFQPYGDIRN